MTTIVETRVPEISIFDLAKDGIFLDAEKTSIKLFKVDSLFVRILSRCVYVDFDSYGKAEGNVEFQVTWFDYKRFDSAMYEIEELDSIYLTKNITGIPGTRGGNRFWFVCQKGCKRKVEKVFLKDERLLCSRCQDIHTISRLSPLKDIGIGKLENLENEYKNLRVYSYNGLPTKRASSLRKRIKQARTNVLIRQKQRIAYLDAAIEKARKLVEK